MKILFYVEPHPIRNTLLHFIDIAKKFSSIVNSANHVDARLFANSEVIQKLFSEKLISPQKVINPTRIEDDIFSVFNVDWESSGTNIWLDLISQGEIAREYYLPIIRRIWNLFPFDIIVYWGENGAVRLFQQEQNITAIGMELGCTRSPFLDSIVMDPYGTNGASVVPKLDIDKIAKIVNYQSITANEAAFLYSGKEMLSYEQQFLPLDQELFGRLTSDKPKAFLPLQLFDDANLLRFSPYKTLSDVVLDVVPKLVEKGYLVIIKPHPAAKYRAGADHANAIAYSNLTPWMDSIIWCNHPNMNYNNIQLMQLSDLVITVNSSVGFEALFFDKVCVVLGEAIYKPKNIFPTLDDILNDSFNMDKYLKSISYLRKYFLDGYLLHQNLWDMPDLFIERLFLLHSLYQKYGCQAENIAKGFFNNPLQIVDYYKTDSFYIHKILEESIRFKPIPILKKEHKESNDIFFINLTKKIIKYSKLKNIEEFEEWLEIVFYNSLLRYELFKKVQFVDQEFYLGHNDVAQAGYEDVTLHYAMHGGIEEGRAPNKYIAPLTSIDDILKKLIEFASELLTLKENISIKEGFSESVFVDRENQLAKIESSLSNRNNKIVVIAHLYYKNLVSQILDYLGNIKEEFDLIITLPTWGTKDIIEQVEIRYPEALFYKCVNRGRDIGPFIDLLPIILNKKYDLALKLHTKNGYFQAGEFISDYSQLWRDESLTALLGSEKRVNTIISAFKDNLKLNMVGASPFFLPFSMYPYSDDGEFLNEILEIDLESNKGGFFAGTMFWFRPEVFDLLISKANLSLRSFDLEQGANDGEIAHILERVFGHLAVYNNGVVAGVDVDLIQEEILKFNLRPAKKPISKHFEEQKLRLGSMLKEELLKRYGSLL